MDLSPFAKVAKYLKDPYVLAGFAIFLLSGFAKDMMGSGLLSQVTGDQTMALLSKVLDYLFIPALFLIIGRIAFPFFSHAVPAAAAASPDMLLEKLTAEAREHGRAQSAAEIADLRKTIDALRAQVADKSAPSGLAAALAAAERSGDTLAIEQLLSRVAAEKAATGAKANRDAAQDLRRAATLARWRDTGQALTYVRQASQLDPDDPWNWIMLGRLERQAGNTPGARDAFAKGEAAAERAKDQRLIAVAASEGGAAVMALGDADAALTHFRRAHQAFEALAKADPKSALAQRDLSLSYNKIGDALITTGDTAAALENFKMSLLLREALAKADPGSAEAQRDLSVSYEKIGNALMKTGDTAAALEYFKKDLGVAEALAKADPTSAKAQRDLSVSYEKIGDALMKTGDTAAALEYFKKDLGVAEALAKADPGSAEAQRDLVVSYVKMSGVAPATERAAWLRRALEIVRAQSAAQRWAPADAWMGANLQARVAAAEKGL